MYSSSTLSDFKLIKFIINPEVHIYFFFRYYFVVYLKNSLNIIAVQRAL